MICKLSDYELCWYKPSTPQLSQIFSLNFWRQEQLQSQYPIIAIFYYVGLLHNQPYMSFMLLYFGKWTQMIIYELPISLMKFIHNTTRPTKPQTCRLSQDMPRRLTNPPNL